MKLIQQNPIVQLPQLLLLAGFSCLLCSAACTGMGGKSLKNAPQMDGQLKMLRSIADIGKRLNTAENGYAAQAKIVHFDSILTVSNDPREKLQAAMKKSIILLEYGDEASAVEYLEKLLSLVGKNENARNPVLYWLGTAYLRLAERNNCVAGHMAEACIMPLKNSGIHQDKSASRKAIETFEIFLAEAPNDPNHMDAIWLLNICYMTIGAYPSNVPKRWLIPGLDAPDYPMKPFQDIASDVNIMVNNRAGGSIVDDFDNDGDLDVVTSAWDIGEDYMHFFRSNGDGTFSDHSAESGLGAFRGGLNIQQTDYNNDGLLDIWVLRGAWQGGDGPWGEQPNSLMRNNGDGTFTDVTIDAGLYACYPTQTATWNDFNHDGWLDVFVGNETMPNKNMYPCQLYINNQNGTFTNVAANLGVDLKMFVKGVTSGDYDNDGWADLFLSCLDGNKVLLRNKGGKGQQIAFENVTAKAGFANEKYRSFPTFFFDYDNDGWLDLFVCNYDFSRSLAYYFAKESLHPSSDPDGKPHFYHNNGDGTFTNVTSTVGCNKVAFSMGANFGDFNNDGFLDIYLGTGNPNYQSIVPNKLFMNMGGKKFADATVSSRTGNLQKGHGVSIVDIDNDGDQDIHIEMGGAYRGDGYPSSLYLNPGQNDNHYIYLQLEGTKSNRAAIGAKITVKFRENGVARSVYRELNSGGSFGSSPLRREIGIGQATVIDEIVLQWPVSGITQTVKNVQPNQMIKLVEGQDGFKPIPLHKVVFKKNGNPIPMCAPAK